MFYTIASALSSPTYVYYGLLWNVIENCVNFAKNNNVMSLTRYHKHLLRWWRSLKGHMTYYEGRDQGTNAILPVNRPIVVSIDRIESSMRLSKDKGTIRSSDSIERFRWCNPFKE
jgi:hypothetical protein